MRISSLLTVFLAMLGVVSNLAAIDLIERPSKGRQFETLRFRFEENLHLDNPFDLETNRVELLVLRPDFSRCVLSFFYDGLSESGEERWEARFAPKQAGLYRFTIQINDTVQTQFDLPVEANGRKKQGGLKVSKRLGVFEYETGEAFRGIGLNVCWTDDYEYYFRKIQAAGMNVTRIWMCPWNLPFEWHETGLGRYNLETSRRLDGILELAEKYGIYVILCMDYHGIARKGLGYFRENRWLANPYNKINGGPCVDGAEIFTNAEAKELFKRKYKYLVSRFGHSSHIAAWEFYNEADLMAGQAIPVNRWHIEMAEYVQSIDVHGRLVSTSATRGYPEKLVDAFKSPAMDFVMFHLYNDLNLAPSVTNLHEMANEYYHKPMVIAEFGVEFRGADRTYKIDPDAIGLHNAIWAGWFNETPIVPLSWWWDNYIDPHNLWGEFSNLSRFAERMSFDVEHLVFKTLTAGDLQGDAEGQAPCLVRAIYSGDDCALWFKNQDFQWSLVYEGHTPQALGPISQVIPDLVPGRYTVTWYDTQTGRFLEQSTDVEVKGDGTLTLSVPSFEKDLACLITRRE